MIIKNDKFEAPIMLSTPDGGLEDHNGNIAKY